MQNKIPLVNLLQGTASDHDFSSGNTLPLVACPWALHHWSLQTGQAPWTFDSRKKKLRGIRLTHQPSPWMRDYASLMLCPFHGDFLENPEHQSSAYLQAETVLQPNVMRTRLLRYDIAIEMAPSRRGAVFVFTKTSSQALKLRFDFDGKHDLAWEPGSTVLRGLTADQFEGESLENFGLHFTGHFNVAPESFQRTPAGGVLVFPENTARVELRLAASFISPEMADTAFHRELAGKSLPAVEADGLGQWNDLLNRIDIQNSSEKQLRTFYSCLYRCLLFPRFMDEEDADGRVVHYSPYDGKIHEGPLCADSGFWDTYRTQYPLLALVYPDILNRMMAGWMNVCRQSGWTPKWASPGSRDCMIGTHFNVLAADMVAKGLTDWNVGEAFEYLWKDATVPGVCGRYGRPGLQEYVERRYIACDSHSYSVSRTLDYAYDDFCIGQIARHLGKTTEADLLASRSTHYRNVFDAKTGFMRGRLAGGQWLEPFDEFVWGGPFIEGGPWQHRFNVPHDFEGLASLMGGKKELCRQLDLMLKTPALFKVGAYPFEIHEMTEMAVAGFGQYAHSNQPVHQFLFLFALAGEPEKTDFWVHKVLSGLYAPDVLPGDEDNGEMSAWYVWASLGLYPVCPGKADYLCFTPSVERAEIHLPGTAPRVLVQSKNHPLPRGLISHQDLIASSRPPAGGPAPENPPPGCGETQSAANSSVMESSAAQMTESAAP